MKTSHQVQITDAREMSLDDNSVELVVTSPPYPMIEMWDELFSELSPDIRGALAEDNGTTAFELMHEELDAVWEELSRVLVDGGIACINVGDATRKVGEGFRVYQNHVRISEAMKEHGFEPLPDVLWRKPTNSGTKFMGSGMVPPNAYVTLEHEYILVFRNGTQRRRFAVGSDHRYQSAYFWEERNQWFTDVWTDITGTAQLLEPEQEQATETELQDVRDRSGAFPLDIPYRLINMYSVYNDTVLDPFWGIGTSTLAAMVAGRNSIGYEIEPAFADIFEQRITDLDALSAEIIENRLDDHRAFIEQRLSEEDEGYEATHYDFDVMTKQETDVQFYSASDVTSASIDTGTEYVVSHDPVATSQPGIIDSLEQAKIDSLSDL
ncbi:DNA-methyltransferase [Halocatena pleomorpha]|uniref:Type II methyltransferase n=1 Tax=Halocatena pleomorpha TaxID=1785090 RepID=A0A3P3RKY5_9EURY|nr:site-specific DNA-methyltransferase [Halocatena pleomorpha]RRJ33520.1 site-specific DNA-methyltransferase [Halocatena pleomorpha]